MLDVQAYLTPARFAACVYPDFQFPPHVQAFQRSTMELIMRPAVNRQLIQAPVRHGKSAWHSVIVPAWHICAFPDKMVCIVAHASGLSDIFSQQVRELVQRAGIVTLDPKWQRRDSFRLLGHRGGLDSIGAEGSISGRGYHYIACDDLVKDEAAARSAVQRESLHRWFLHDCLSRVEPGGKVSLVMSRRSPADLSGQMLDLNPELPDYYKWHELKFKAIQDDGSALWPARWPIEVLEAKRREYELAGQSYAFDALYQQDPYADPTLIEFPATYFTAPDFQYDETRVMRPLYTFGAVDTAAGRSEQGDYSCAVYMIMEPDGHLYVHDSLLMRCPVAEFEQHAAAFFARTAPDAILIEANVDSSFATHMQDIARTAYNSALYCNTIVHKQPKDVRLRQYLSPVLHQHVLHFRNTPANKLIVAQCRELFSGSHDDGPDCVSMAIEMMKAFLGDPI